MYLNSYVTLRCYLLLFSTTQMFRCMYSRCTPTTVESHFSGHVLPLKGSAENKCLNMAYTFAYFYNCINIYSSNCILSRYLKMAVNKF